MVKEWIRRVVRSGLEGWLRSGLEGWKEWIRRVD